MAAAKRACPGIRTRTSKPEETEMPKLKTKSSAKKRFRLTATGKVRAGVAFKRHNLRKRSQKMKRKARGTVMLCDADARIVKSYMPYA
jgi:large subunit ribosomal protein L35